MAKVYRITASVFGIGVLLLLLSIHALAQTGSKADVEMNVPFPPFPAENQQQASDINRPCDASFDNRKSDLCAQWKAADASRASADWAERSFFMGTVIGVLTLFSAAAAAIYAKQAASETKKSADTSLNALFSTRAWICNEFPLTRPEEKITFNDQFYEWAVKIGPRFKNFGQTPATNVAVCSHYFVCKADVKPDELQIPEVDPEKLIGSGFIPAGWIHGYHSWYILIGDDLEGILAGSHVLIIHTLMAYRDVFEPEKLRVTEETIAMYHVGDMAKPKEFSPLFQSNRFGDRQRNT